jgi:serine/threonine-protein kinase
VVYTDRVVPDPDRLIGLPLFGGYRITRKIGEGGMGAVYVAENSELQKRLAVKVLLPDRLAHSTAIKRFLAEARAASAINHRNIIEILDSSTLADGRHYILMEYLEGTTLRRYARGLGPMPMDVSLAVLAQVCSGLQAAHERGIVHRDLKPSNIFIAPQPDNPYFTKLLDFGIAKLEDPGLAGDLETKSQTVAGTPGYMSPEQARALRDVDHRTDLYSLGVIAYELLSGRLPYKAQSIGDLVYQQASTRPALLAQLRADLPRGWHDVVHAAICLEPEGRPRSALEFARLLIAATPNGEQIARATASLLFAPTSGSDLSAPSGRFESGSSDWSVASMPAQPIRSVTESVADDGQFPGVPSAESGSASRESIASRRDAATAIGYPVRTGPSRPSLALPSVPELDPPPTTLGMSASQMSMSKSPSPDSARKMMFAAMLLIGAALGGLAIFLWIDSQRAGGGATPAPAATEPAPANPVVKPLAADTLPDPVDAAVVDEPGVDAGVQTAAGAPDAEPVERAGKPKKPKRPKQPGDEGARTDEELFDGRK